MSAGCIRMLIGPETGAGVMQTGQSLESVLQATLWHRPASLLPWRQLPEMLRLDTQTLNISPVLNCLLHRHGLLLQLRYDSDLLESAAQV